MPTGYTAGIEDGTISSANEFILLCARAFGAAIEMRDEPLTNPIRKSEPSSYHYDRLKEAQIEYERLETMTLDEAEIEVSKIHREKVERAQKQIAKQTEINQRYMNILSDVRLWQPPSINHSKLKEFAINQITMCIDNDMSYWEKQISEPRQTPQEFLEFRISQSRNDIKYHSDEWQKEVERCNSQNLWVELLKESLPT